MMFRINRHLLGWCNSKNLEPLLCKRPIYTSKVQCAQRKLKFSSFGWMQRWSLFKPKNAIAIGSYCILGLTGSGCILYYTLRRNVATAASLTPKGEEEEDEEEEQPKKKKPLTLRERRFLRFASVEYEHQIYMTPRDFLDSVTQENPRHRIHRRALSEKEVNDMLKKTPARLGWSSRSATKSFFRGLDTNGLISYTEYLFLLCVLTKPKSGFRIAFNMFDMDGNQRVDKSEFLVIQALTLMLRKGGKIASFEDYLEEIWGKTKKPEDSTKTARDKADEIERSSRQKTVWNKPKLTEKLKIQETTLLRHFFGPKGNWDLTYEDFEEFSERLQTEVLEIEFNEFSRGKPTISETEFAKILLRYTVVHLDDYKAYLDRVAERIPEETGISFDQFRQFCQFLNNLDDFSIAVKLYSFADLSVSQAEFARAVKISTGYALDAHVVNTVFSIFDVNNDGQLSYEEFIAVMKDRIHRGFRSHLVRGEKWLDAWKACVREEIKNY